jgi:hypothetical protein
MQAATCVAEAAARVLRVCNQPHVRRWRDDGEVGRGAVNEEGAHQRNEHEEPVLITHAAIAAEAWSPHMAAANVERQEGRSWSHTAGHRTHPAKTLSTHTVESWQAPEQASIALGEWLKEKSLCAPLGGGIAVPGVAGQLTPHASYPTVGGCGGRDTYVVKTSQLRQLRQRLKPFDELCAAVEERVQARCSMRLGLEVRAMARVGVAQPSAPTFARRSAGALARREAPQRRLLAAAAPTRQKRRAYGCLRSGSGVWPTPRQPRRGPQAAPCHHCA